MWIHHSVGPGDLLPFLLHAPFAMRPPLLAVAAAAAAAASLSFPGMHTCSSKTRAFAALSLLPAGGGSSGGGGGGGPPSFAAVCYCLCFTGVRGPSVHGNNDNNKDDNNKDHDNDDDDDDNDDNNDDDNDNNNDDNNEVIRGEPTFLFYSTILSSLLCSPILLLVQMKNKWNISHTSGNYTARGGKNKLIWKL
jgi:hypothetical protein